LLNRPVLVLNQSYEPIQVCSVRRAIVLVFRGRAEVIEALDLYVRTVSERFPVPSVVRLGLYVRVAPKQLALSKKNVLKRDGHRCQYCGSGFPVGELTFDHVVPVSQGGRKDWENIVTACIPCNRRKGGRTPAQAGMQVIRPPCRPTRSPVVRITFGLRDAPESWRDYLYWNVELDQT
jgi:5-methylcytosine-specific restriction endonuclease McrA